MKNHFLTTAALALVLAAGSASAQVRQDRGGPETSKERSAQQPLNERADHPMRARPLDRQADHPMRARPETTGQSSESGRNAADSSRGMDSSRGSANNGGITPDQKRTSASERSNRHNALMDRDKSRSRSSASNQRNRDRTSEKSSRTSEKSSRTNEKQRATTGERPKDQADRGRNEMRQSANRGQRHERLSASLQSEQKTRLTRAIARVNVRPVTRVNFSLAVGTFVPRSIVLHPLPVEIVEIVPEYRGYDFFVVRDEIVIVEPRSHHIVDVIARSGGPARAESTTTREKLRLSSGQRDIIRRGATSHQTTGSAVRTETHIVVGEEVPQAVEIEEFPETIYREVPAIRPYRYIHSDTGVYLVEPRTRRVIEFID